MTAAPQDPLQPLRTRSWIDEARRKAIHLYALVLPLGVLFQITPWPRGRAQWSEVLGALTVIALLIDLIRLQHAGLRGLFKRFFGGMIREHEAWTLLGSTYLLIAAVLAVDLFPRSIAGTALGFTVLGDAFAAMVGRAWGRHRVFGKSLEGAAAGLAISLVWAGWLASVGVVPWWVGVAGALTASLVELLPIPLDDNLGMTLASAAVMLLVMPPLRGPV